jgi:hypothetical protein
MGWRRYLTDDAGGIRKVELTAAESASVEVLTEDGAADSAFVFASLGSTAISSVRLGHPSPPVTRGLVALWSQLQAGVARPRV